MMCGATPTSIFKRLLAAHALDREQHLLAVRAHAEDNEQRDGGRLAIEPHVSPRVAEVAREEGLRFQQRVEQERKWETENDRSTDERFE
jgi:hypothetical protein